jgi:hypothetical protein
MVKVILLLKRRPGLSLAEFIEHYEEIHIPLVEKLSTRAQSYQRHFLHPMPDLYGRGEPLEPEYDVVTEIVYEDMEAFRAEQRDAARQPDLVAAIIADEKELFDRPKTRLALAEDRVSPPAVP